MVVSNDCEGIPNFLGAWLCLISSFINEGKVLLLHYLNLDLQILESDCARGL